MEPVRDYTSWMQSRFYNPAFNSAIFDGPIRIYFAQVHEPLALKIYFGLQQQYEEIMQVAKQAHKELGVSLCVLIYPNGEAFEMSFADQLGYIVKDQLGNDPILALRGPFEDGELPLVLRAVAQELVSWDSELDGEAYPVLAAEA